MNPTAERRPPITDPLPRIPESEQTRSVRRYLEALDDIADGHPVDSFAALQQKFVAAAAGYAARYATQFKTWLAARVPADVLAQADIAAR